MKILLNKVKFLTNKSKIFIKYKMLKIGCLHNKISFLGLYSDFWAIPGWQLTSTVLRSWWFWLKIKGGTHRNAIVTHITRILDSRRFFWCMTLPWQPVALGKNFNFLIVGQTFSIHTAAVQIDFWQICRKWVHFKVVVFNSDFGRFFG